MLSTRWWWIVLMVTPVVGWSQEAWTLKAADVSPPAAVVAELRSALGKSALELQQGGVTVARYWLREKTPTKPLKKDFVTYDLIEEGTLLGVAEIIGAGLTDFRGQALAAGVYTLRLGVQPQDGNHMGVADANEFLCLAPVQADQTLAAVPHDRLMDLSKKAASTGHPVVLFLHPFTKRPEPAPVLLQTATKHTVLSTQVQSDRGAPIPIGIVIVGKTDAG